MTPEQFDRLVAANMTTEQIGVVMKMLAEETAALKAAEEARKAVARERVQKWRAKRNVTETQPKRNGNAPQRLTRADPSLSTLEPTGQEESKKDTSPAARSRGERIPDGFLPDVGWAEANGLSPADARTEASQFIDYWRGKPGKDGVKLDWPGTWRMWVRNAIKRRGRSPPGKRGYADVVNDRLDKANGQQGIFGDRGNVECFPPRRIESRPHDENIRGGIAGRIVGIDR